MNSHPGDERWQDAAAMELPRPGGAAIPKTPPAARLRHGSSATCKLGYDPEKLIFLVNAAPPPAVVLGSKANPGTPDL